MSSTKRAVEESEACRSSALQRALEAETELATMKHNVKPESVVSKSISTALRRNNNGSSEAYLYRGLGTGRYVVEHSLMYIKAHALQSTASTFHLLNHHYSHL
jgi:hypothetical protein